MSTPDDLFEYRCDCLEYLGNPPANNHEAHQLSLAKWRVIIEIIKSRKPNKGNETAFFHDGGRHTCGFCMLYNNYSYNADTPAVISPYPDCYGCPIAAETGEIYCHDTPFDMWEGAVSYDEHLYAAGYELEYLESLKVHD